MVQLVVSEAVGGEDAALRGMFAARKEVFIDLLGWDLPALAGLYELDAFDNEHARYLILTDHQGRHLASARLVPTSRPHILDSIFPVLCGDGVPRGPQIREITRFCLDRRLDARERRLVRNHLITVIVQDALNSGVMQYTGVAEMGWLQQILSFGWDCAPLGLPAMHGAKMLGALVINIDEATPARLDAAGIWSPVEEAVRFPQLRAAGQRG
jgi:N-acyl-L-homoserine lactone synthetase